MTAKRERDFSKSDRLSFLKTIATALLFLVLCGLLPAQPQPAVRDQQACGVVSSKSDLSGVSLEVTSTECSFSQRELRKGVRIDYVIVVEHEIAGVLSQPQDATGCQKPGASGLIAFRVIRGPRHVYCPQCDLGFCARPPHREPATLHPGRYPEILLWNGKTFSGNGEGMNTVPEQEFPPGSYVLSIKAIGRHHAREKGAADVSFTVSLEYRINIVASNGEKDFREGQTTSGGNLP